MSDSQDHEIRRLRGRLLAAENIAEQRAGHVDRMQALIRKVEDERESLRDALYQIRMLIDSGADPLLILGKVSAALDAAIGSEED